MCSWPTTVNSIIQYYTYKIYFFLIKMIWAKFIRNFHLIPDGFWCLDELVCLAEFKILAFQISPFFCQKFQNSCKKSQLSISISNFRILEFLPFQKVIQNSKFYGTIQPNKEFIEQHCTGCHKFLTARISGINFPK